MSWRQTELDGLMAAPLDCLDTGASWRWHGEAVRIDGPRGVLLLEHPTGEEENRRRAARLVKRMLGAALEISEPEVSEAAEDEQPGRGFVLTDGRRQFHASVVSAPEAAARLVMFVGEVPPEGEELWVVRVTADRAELDAGTREQGGVICFTPGTWLRTPDGATLIEDLRPGQLLQTKDNGAQEVLWVGQRRLSGARLFAYPHLRPVRIMRSAFGDGRPDSELLVSPQHRMLVQNPEATNLFNTSEVLVTALDLVDNHNVIVDMRLREVTYVHVLLAQHEIIWANGLETESFHPSGTSLDSLDPECREELYRVSPDLRADPRGYGDYARRALSRSEAAILRYAAA